ncbi:BCCT family transporter, partial [Siminovitchia fortis]|uniref:BCCT family transporter n=1 Tax=Siminovitchia fortis TaxID=254758 RepID=UPI0021B2A32F
MRLATSLPLGILQINPPLHYFFSIPQNTPVLLIITPILLLIYLTSPLTPLDTAIKILTIFNLTIPLPFLLILLLLPPTTFILHSFTVPIPHYIHNFFPMSLSLSP